MADLSDTIEAVAGKPQVVSGDAGSRTAQPIPDLIAADEYLKAQAALAGDNGAGGPKSAFRCLRPARAQQPGAK